MYMYCMINWLGQAKFASYLSQGQARNQDYFQALSETATCTLYKLDWDKGIIMYITNGAVTS